MRRATTLTLGLALCAALFLATLAGGRGPGGINPTEADLRQGIHVERDWTNRRLENRCYPQRNWTRRVREIPDENLRGNLRWVQSRRVQAGDLRSICAREGAIVRLVFKQRSWAALTVARCESHLYRYAVGAAGERGIFQIHPVHAGWLGPLWDQLFNPLVNAQVAWRMSKRGTDWGPWTCQP